MNDFEYRKVRASLPYGMYHVEAVRVLMCMCLNREVSIEECKDTLEKLWEDERKKNPDNSTKWKDIERKIM